MRLWREHGRRRPIGRRGCLKTDGRTGSSLDRFHWASNGFVPPSEADGAGGEEGGHGAAVVGKVGGGKEAESETSP